MKAVSKALHCEGKTPTSSADERLIATLVQLIFEVRVHIVKPGLDLKVESDLNESEIRLCLGALWSTVPKPQQRNQHCVIGFDKMGQETWKKQNGITVCVLLNHTHMLTHPPVTAVYFIVKSAPFINKSSTVEAHPNPYTYSRV